MLINTIWCPLSICGPATEWLVAVGTLFLGLVAFIGIDEVRSLIFKPCIRPKELKLVRTEHHREDRPTLIYHRLIVKNVWRWLGRSARDVRVLLTYKKAPENFIPIPLRWTYLNTFERDISRGEPAYLDVLEEKGSGKYEFCWARNVAGSGSAEGILREFDARYGDLRMEFYERSGGKIGDMTLRYFLKNNFFKVIDNEDC